MRLRILKIAVLIAAMGLLGAARQSPLRDDVVLSLTANRAEYSLYETVHLTVELRNVTDHDIVSWLALTEASESCDIQYRHGAGGFASFPIMRSMRGMSSPSVLAPGQAISGEYVVAYDIERHQHILESPGVVEFRAVCNDAPGYVSGDPNDVVESEVVAVNARPVPEGESGPAAMYVSGTLARLAQYDLHVGSDLPRESISTAAEFLRVHGRSIYARDLSGGLLLALGRLVSLGVATEDELALHGRLRTDATAPSIAVRALPAKLWPPNHQLAPVTMEVIVSDDLDLQPEVKLVSINCDDSCAADQDVVGADIGTDDRQFELRAERTGSGGGRTYTITYSATDTSGNEGKALAKVLVPHDQGKK